MFSNISYPNFMFRQATEPVGVSQGALWFNTSSLILSIYNGTSWQSIGSLGLSPIGSVVAWLKSLTGTPAIPTGWVECNGQVLDDEESLYDGVTIPDLNGSLGAGLKGRFLRGHSVSGEVESSQNLAHTHSITPMYSYTNCSGTGSIDLYRGDNGNSINTQSEGGTEARPSNYSVVWIMRVK